MNFIGSTANTVAMMSSVLCLRPLTSIRPSRLPHTNIRPPCTHRQTDTSCYQATLYTQTDTTCYQATLYTQTDRHKLLSGHPVHTDTTVAISVNFTSVVYL